MMNPFYAYLVAEHTVVNIFAFIVTLLPGSRKRRRSICSSKSVIHLKQRAKSIVFYLVMGSIWCCVDILWARS